MSFLRRRHQRTDAELAADPVADLVGELDAAFDVTAEGGDEDALAYPGPGACRRWAPATDGRGRRGQRRGEAGGRERKAMRSLHCRNLQSVDQEYTDVPRRVRYLAARASSNYMGEEGLEPPTSCV